MRAAFAAFFAACLPVPAGVLLAQEAQEPVILTVSETIVPRSDDMAINGQAQRAVLKAFNERYPWIEVVRFGGIKLQNVAMDVGPLMAIAADIAPSVLYVNFRKSDSYIRQGFLHPLDEYVGELEQSELDEIVFPSIKPVIRREGPDSSEHWWAMPYGNFVIALYYRKDLFHEAGLDPDRPPKTWDELLDYAQKLTNPEKAVYGMGFGGGPTASWNFYTFLLSTGARAVSQGADGVWRATFDSPEVAQAVHFYTRLLQEPFRKDGRMIQAAGIRDVDIYMLWEQGKIGMFQDYLGDRLIAGVNPELIGIAPVPAGPTGLRGSEVNSPCMGIYAGIKDKRVRDAAWAFIRFWCGTEATRIRTRVYVENGFGRFINPTHLRKYGYPEYLRRVPKGWEAAFQQAMHDGVPEPYGKNCDLIYWYMTKPLDIAVVENLGRKPADIALPRIQELLRHWTEETNQKMMGIIPPDTMLLRRRVAMAVSAMIILAFVMSFRYLMRVFTPEDASKRRWAFGRYKTAYMLLIPAVLLMGVWQYVPTVRGAIIAFMDYRIMGGSKFIFLDNFGNVLFDSVFWKTLGNSLYYASLILLLGFFSPIILALLLHEVPKGKIFFRVVFYLPAVVSGLVVIFLWKSFYDPSESGLLNSLLGIFRIPPQGWLTQPRWAMLSVVLPIVWAGMGPGCLIYLAALKTIPEELYESAEIDGANIWQKLWNVTVPTIKPLIIITFVGAFIAAFKASDFILAMTGGGPADATTVLELQIFYDAFLYLRFGPATAMAWLLGFILLGFTVYQMKRLSRMQFTTVAD